MYGVKGSRRQVGGSAGGLREVPPTQQRPRIQPYLFVDLEGRSSLKKTRDQSELQMIYPERSEYSSDSLSLGPYSCGLHT